jgi:DNA-binding transcriptional ArsR family regulator
VRRRILEVLSGQEHAAGAIVTVIQREFGITQSAVSQHLKLLRDSGFATVRIDGARRIYTLDAAPLQQVDGWLEHFRAFWAPKLDALATEVARGKKQRAAKATPQLDFGFFSEPE